MALDSKDKRAAVIQLAQPQNPVLPDPDGILSLQDRAQLLFIPRNVQEETLTFDKRLALLQVGMVPVMTLPDPDGDLDSSDRRHLLGMSRFEGNILSIPSTNLAFSSEAPTLGFLNTKISIPTGSLTLSSDAPTVTPDWVANNWWNPFWVLPLADFSSRQGAWWGPSDINDSVEIPTGSVTLTTFAPAVSTAVSPNIVVPSADLELAGASPSVNIGKNTIVLITEGVISVSTEAPSVYYEEVDQVIIPAGDLVVSSVAPALSYIPRYNIASPSADLALSTAAPTLTTRVAELVIPSANLTLTGSDLIAFAGGAGVGIQPEVTEGSTGGRYGRPMVSLPKKKKRPLPDGDGIAAVHVGDNVLVSRAPELKVTRLPEGMADTLRMLRRMDKEIAETKKGFTAEIKSFREAFEAREAQKEREAREAKVQALERKKRELEQQLAENQELVASLLLLMVE